MLGISISNHLKKLQQTMKKYSVLFAALAVIALAGCKKEENKVNGIIIGGETCQNVDKLAYTPDSPYALFDGTDGILFNGVSYNYTMIDNPMDRNEVTGSSNYAILNVNLDPMPEDVTILYPDNVFDMTGAIYVSPYDYDFMMVDETPNAGVANPVTGCVWPMGYHTDNFHSHGQIQLKNAIALITTSIKYGYTCFNNLRSNNTAFADLPYANTNADLPQMKVTKVELIADRKLTGNAHVEFDAEDNPFMVMDDPLTEGTTDILAATAPNGYMIIPAAGNTETYVGSIPVTPNLVGAEMSMKVYFDLTLATGAIYHCVYNGTPQTINAGDIRRSYRTVFIANMFTGQNWTKIALVGRD